MFRSMSKLKALRRRFTEVWSCLSLKHVQTPWSFILPLPYRHDGVWYYLSNRCSVVWSCLPLETLWRLVLPPPTGTLENWSCRPLQALWRIGLASPYRHSGVWSCLPLEILWSLVLPTPTGTLENLVLPPPTGSLEFGLPLSYRHNPKGQLILFHGGMVAMV